VYHSTLGFRAIKKIKKDARMLDLQTALSVSLEARSKRALGHVRFREKREQLTRL